MWPKKPEQPEGYAPKDPPAPDEAADFRRSPTAMGTEDPTARRLGEPRPDEPPAAADPNNPNRVIDAVKAVPIADKDDKKLARLAGTDSDGHPKKTAEALVARYAESHGRWQTVTARTHTGAGNARAFVWCDCAICQDARAHLKMED